MRQHIADLQGIEQRCRQAEAALTDFEERSRHSGESAPLGIFTLDSQGGITGINRKMLEMLPWPSNVFIFSDTTPYPSHSFIIPYETPKP